MDSHFPINRKLKFSADGHAAGGDRDRKRRVVPADRCQVIDTGPIALHQVTGRFGAPELPVFLGSLQFEALQVGDLATVKLDGAGGIPLHIAGTGDVEFAPDKVCRQLSQAPGRGVFGPQRSDDTFNPFLGDVIDQLVFPTALVGIGTDCFRLQRINTSKGVLLVVGVECDMRHGLVHDVHELFYFSAGDL